jgi:hypothetical protein
VEASLLPSKEIAALATRVTLAVVRTIDPSCAGLRKEFGVPYLNSWVVVLDAKGEVLASWMGDVAGTGCRESAAATFPGSMARLIRKSLRVAESLEELERRWQKDIGNLSAFDTYARRLQQMHRFEELQKICHAQVGNPRLTADMRKVFRIREFLTRGSACRSDLHTSKGRARFARAGEKLLIELADHPKAADFPAALFGFVYAHGFDVPARSAEAIARLTKAVPKHPHPSALKERIRQLEKVAEDWIKEMKKYLSKAEGLTQKQFLAASLGDAQAAVDLFSQEGYRDVRDYRDRLVEATRKLRSGGVVRGQE